MNLIVDYATRVGGVIVLLFIANWFSKWVGRTVEKRLGGRKFDPTLTRFFSSFARQAIMLLAVLACLGVFGVETTSFAAVIAAMGLAVGLAFQGSLSNFAAGVMLLVFRPFKVGDVVKAAGVTGKIIEIELFTTRMDTPDNRRLILPNSAVFGGTIENVTFHETRRVDLTVGCDYNADLRQSRALLQKVVAELEGALQDPAPAVVLVNLGDSSVDWAVRVWCKTGDYFAVLERLTEAVKDALDGAKIGIPYPTMDVNIVSNAA